MKTGTRFAGYAMVLLSAFLFGCMPLITNYIYAEGINRESVVLMRNLFALPVLAVLTWRQSKSFRIPVKALPAIGVIAVMGCCVTPLLLYGSYQYMATGAATVFHFVYPAMVVLIGVIFLKKKINKGTLLSVMLCVVGICLFYNPREPLDWRGAALALTSGVSYAVYVVLLAGFRHPEVSGFKLSFYILSICSVVMLTVCLISGKLTIPTTQTGWLLNILFSLIISVGAVVMFQRGALLLGGERASVLSTVEPLTGVVVGAIAFQEAVTPGTVIGSVFVIAACILITVFDRKEK